MTSHALYIVYETPCGDRVSDLELHGFFTTEEEAQRVCNKIRYQYGGAPHIKEVMTDYDFFSYGEEGPVRFHHTRHD